MIPCSLFHAESESVIRFQIRPQEVPETAQEVTIFGVFSLLWACEIFYIFLPKSSHKMEHFEPIHELIRYTGVELKNPEF